MIALDSPILRLQNVDMGKLDNAVARAIGRAPLSLTDLADEMGVHRTLLHKIHRGERSATPETAGRLAKVLQRHGRQLEELAQKLEAAAAAERERRAR